MRFPAVVVEEKDTAKVFTELLAAFAVAWTNEIVAVCATVSVRVAVPVPPLSVALSVIVEVAAAVGVPEINPVPLFTARPDGNPVAP
jgi:hypothetical protein